MKHLIILALASILAVPGPAAAQPKEVVIGVIYPMSGPSAQAGIDNKPAFEIAAEIANGTTNQQRSSAALMHYLYNCQNRHILLENCYQPLLCISQEIRNFHTIKIFHNTNNPSTKKGC